MILFVSVIALGIVLGYALGGRLEGFQELRLRWWGLAIAGLALQFLPLPEGAAGNDLFVRTAVLGISYSLLVVFAFSNVRLPGMALVLIGLTANLIVIVANGGMPVSEAALRDSGQAALISELRAGGADKHHLMNDGDVLTFLADVIGVPKPIGQAVSLGDVLQYSGLIWLTIATMRGRIPSSQPASEPYRGKHRRGGQSRGPNSPPPAEPLPAATRWGTGP